MTLDLLWWEELASIGKMIFFSNESIEKIGLRILVFFLMTSPAPMPNTVIYDFIKQSKEQKL